MTDTMTGAVGEARTVVEAQTQLPAPQRAAVISGIEQNVARMAASPNEAGTTADPLAGAPQAPAGSPAAEQQDELKLQLGSIFSTARADAFDLPFLVAAAVALVGVVPALLLGRRRRVAADEGDESDVWGSVADVA
jgi:hypothetical protein